MSINSMTNSAAARRTDFVPFDSVPKDLNEIAQSAAAFPRARAVVAGAPVAVQGGAAAAPAPAPETASTNAMNTALNTLFGFVPTEVLTLYVAVVAAFDTTPAPGTVAPKGPLDFAFKLFLFVTPLTVWVAFASKIKNAGKPLPLSPKQWPLWEMIAATIAYAAWAFSLPKFPYDFVDAYPGIRTVVVLLTSGLLGLLAPLFSRPLPS